MKLGEEEAKAEYSSRGCDAVPKERTRKIGKVKNVERVFWEGEGESGEREI